MAGVENSSFHPINQGGIDQIPEQKIPHSITTRRQLVVLGGFAGIGMLVGIACKPQDTAAAAAAPGPKTEPLAPTVADTPIPTEIIAPTLVLAAATAEKVIPTSSPIPTNSPKSTITNTPTATATDTVTAIKTSTPTATETPKPIEKSPLPSYGAFTGNGVLDNKHTKPEEGKIVIASIPQKEGPDKILIYYIMNDRSYNVLLTDLKNTQGNSFESTNPEIRKVMSAGRYTLQGDFDPSNNKLKGDITEGSSSGQTIQVFTFQAELIGNGKENVLKAAKQMKLATGKYGGNWQNVNVDYELRGINLP